MSENSIVFTHVDEARKANLHGYKRITIRPAIYERGLFSQARVVFGRAQLDDFGIDLPRLNKKQPHERCHTLTTTFFNSIIKMHVPKCRNILFLFVF